MLYAEHILRQLNHLGREPLILRVLDHEMPSSLRDLYERQLDELQRQTPTEQQMALKSLLCWLSYSFRLLTLDECLAILTLVPNSSYNLEDRLQGQHLSRILKLADAGERQRSDSSQSPELLQQTQTDQPTTFYDGDLPLKIRDRSMRDFLRQAKEDETGLRSLSLDAHCQIFAFCSGALSGSFGKVPESLRKYAAKYWAFHLFWTESKKLGDKDAAHLEAVGTIMAGSRVAAQAIESSGVEYDDVVGLPQERLLTFMQTVAGTIVSLGDKMSITTRAWAQSVVADKSTAFVSLARAHVENWLQADDGKSLLRSLKFARSCLQLVSFHC